MEFNSKKLQQKSPILIVSEEMNKLIVCKTVLDQIYDFNSSLKFSSMLDQMPNCLFIGTEQSIMDLNIPNEFKKFIKTLPTSNQSISYEEINNFNNQSLDLVIQMSDLDQNFSNVFKEFKEITDVCRKKQIPIISIGELQITPTGNRIVGGSRMEFASNTIYKANRTKGKLSFTIIKDRAGGALDFELPLIN